ncbi:hypothetical protein HDE69_005197 [Pedobacter cryoconitis]|uniref:Uncharacterized protein n=1 Tax=Pedobacter cryoconitis TaxID=188932 RepID=A0A7W9DNC4_9SPHI|nr:hypothetical protein [Pedobacter cryoconitis]MBB5624100.1 hypothetical protein [Pedobacter cryoconitis]
MVVSLKQIKLTLQDILNNFDWDYSATDTTHNYYKIDNLTHIRSILNQLDSLDMFSEVVKELQHSVIFTTSSDNIRVSSVEAKGINANLELIKTLSSNFLSVLLTTVPEESVDSINIKLPPINDFDELSKVSREIHIALSQVLFNDDINGETKIISVENGSIWLNVFVGMTAVTFIASLIWSSAVIYKKILEGRLLEQQIRGLKVKNESLEDVLKAQKAETEMAIAAEADHISSEFFKINEAENIEKIKNSITIFADLISKGAEIHPALVAQENVSNLFPDPTKLIGIESKIKRLSGGNEN